MCVCRGYLPKPFFQTGDYSEALPESVGVLELHEVSHGYETEMNNFQGEWTASLSSKQREECYTLAGHSFQTVSWLSKGIPGCEVKTHLPEVFSSSLSKKT